MRELQDAVAEATCTSKRTAGTFLDTLSGLAYKETKKNGEFVLPGFGKLVKQKRKARMGLNPQTRQKIKIRENSRKISSLQGGEGCDSWREKIDAIAFCSVVDSNCQASDFLLCRQRCAPDSIEARSDGGGLY